MLEHNKFEISLDEEVMKNARKGIERMLELA
jgi:quinolinate synthase